MTTDVTAADISSSQVQSTINPLVTSNRDAVEGYQKAAELLTDEQYTQICHEFAEQRKRFIHELTSLMEQHGGVSTDTQSFADVVHDLWMEIRNTVNSDDAAILAECDRGDEAAIELYQNALTEPLSNDVETLLRKQFAELKGAHERIHRLAAALQQ